MRRHTTPITQALQTFTFGCTCTRPIFFFSHLPQNKSGVSLQTSIATFLLPNQSLFFFFLDLLLSSAHPQRLCTTAQVSLYLLLLQTLVTEELTFILALLLRAHHCSDVGMTACRLHFSWPSWWQGITAAKLELAWATRARLAGAQWWHVVLARQVSQLPGPPSPLALSLNLHEGYWEPCSSMKLVSSASALFCLLLAEYWDILWSLMANN